MTTDGILAAVEAHVLAALGPDTGRASVTFLGTERYEVLRFGPAPGGMTRYVTLGMSRAPMVDPGSFDAQGSGPRAELVLTLEEQADDVARTLAVLAASPAVEGVVVMPGATLRLGEPLWAGAPETAVLVGEPGDLLPDLELGDGLPPVRFLPVWPA